MSERFERIYELPTSQYSNESPVMVSAGVLLHDTQTDNRIIQLKFKSFSQEKIYSVYVEITIQNRLGIVLQKIVEYKYYNLNVRKGEYFGSDKAILVHEPDAASFKVSQIVVEFESGTQKTIPVPGFLPANTSLNATLKTDDLISRYQAIAGKSALCVPQQSRDLWQCACGEWNKDQKCTQCSSYKDDVFSKYNQLLAEQKAKEAQEKVNTVLKLVAPKTQAEPKEIPTSTQEPIAPSQEQPTQQNPALGKNKKILVLIGIIAALVITLVIALPKVINTNSDKTEYDNALALLTDEDTSEHSGEEIMDALNLVMSECAHNRLSLLMSPPKQPTQQYYQHMIDVEGDLLLINTSIIPNADVRSIVADYQDDIQNKQDVLEQYAASPETDWSIFVDNFDWHRIDITQSISLWSLHTLNFIELSDTEYSKCTSNYLEAQIASKVFGNDTIEFETYSDEFVQLHISVINNTNVSFSSFALYTYWNDYTAENTIKQWDPNTAWDFIIFVPYDIAASGNIVIGLQSTFESSILNK